MKERIIIVFIAVILGLFLTIVVFLIYQSTKIVPKEKHTSISKTLPSPTSSPTTALFLSVDEPENESVTNKRTIEIKGKTNAANTVIISSNIDDDVIKPSSQGTFSATITIDAGTNKIVTRAIAPNGEEASDERIISYSSEDF